MTSRVLVSGYTWDVVLCHRVRSVNSANAAGAMLVTSDTSINGNGTVVKS